MAATDFVSTTLEPGNIPARTYELGTWVRPVNESKDIVVPI